MAMHLSNTRARTFPLYCNAGQCNEILINVIPLYIVDNLKCRDNYGSFKMMVIPDCKMSVI